MRDTSHQADIGSGGACRQQVCLPPIQSSRSEANNLFHSFCLTFGRVDSASTTFTGNAASIPKGGAFRLSHDMRVVP